MIKVFCIPVLLCQMLAGQIAAAQEKSAMTLSNSQPEAGKVLTVVYDPAGTILQGKETVNVTVGIYRSDRSRAIDIKPDWFKEEGKKRTFGFTVPATASAFFITAEADHTVDANNGKGYIYQVYQNGKPVERSFGSLGLAYCDGRRLGIRPDSIKALALLRQELALFPGLKREFADTYFSLLWATDRDDNKKMVTAGIDSLMHTGKEDDMNIVMRTYFRIKNKTAADSVAALAREKFPRGKYALINYINNSYSEKNPDKKVVLYEAIPAKFDADAIADGMVSMDYIREDIAQTYYRAGNFEKAIEYIYKVESRIWRGQAYVALARELVKKNEHLEVAEKLLKQSIDDAKEFMTTRKEEEGADFAVLGYGTYCSIYGELLYNLKKYTEALTYVEDAYNRSRKDDPEINAAYANILSALGKEKEAMTMMEDMIKKGKAMPGIKEQLKNIYIKAKGSDAGYDAYLASLQAAMVTRVRTELASQMINKAAPAFALKDMEGNTVSLAGLKGKTVVVDFWATWCGPCKKSFPAMQLAVNRFKNNSNVVFLFVDTWEHVPDARSMVKEFINNNKYSFQVLFDTAPVSGQKFVAEQFNVSGIPTKFVIDKNGNIRFRFTGFSGDESAAVEELSEMIRLADKS